MNKLNKAYKNFFIYLHWIKVLNTSCPNLVAIACGNAGDFSF